MINIFQNLYNWILLCETKYLVLFIFVFVGCTQNNVPNNLSDIEISYIAMKDINAPLIEVINKDIALCFKSNYNSDTMYMELDSESRIYLDSGEKYANDISAWGGIIEYKNIGKDKLVLLGNYGGKIFSASYSFGETFNLFFSDFAYERISNNDINAEMKPCPIELLPQQSYYYLEQDLCFEEKCKKHPSMDLFIYYKPEIDSVYRYWFIRSETKVTDNALELLERTKNDLSAERYNVYYHMFRDSYMDTKRIFKEDSLVKSWINE